MRTNGKCDEQSDSIMSTRDFALTFALGIMAVTLGLLKKSSKSTATWSGSHPTSLHSLESKPNQVCHRPFNKHPAGNRMNQNGSDEDNRTQISCCPASPETSHPSSRLRKSSGSRESMLALLLTQTRRHTGLSAKWLLPLSIVVP